ncbi:hypothetical protein Q5752_003204 [Cryptotrichosporon argae]
MADEPITPLPQPARTPAASPHAGPQDTRLSVPVPAPAPSGAPSSPAGADTSAPSVGTYPPPPARIDVDEFDPYATPAPAPIGPGGGAAAVDLGKLVLAPTPLPGEPPSETAHAPSLHAATSTHAATPKRTATPARSTSRPTTPLVRNVSGGAQDEVDGGRKAAAQPTTPAAAARETAVTAAAAAAGAKDEPAFNFSGFLRDLRGKSAEPVARYLKSFLSNFAKKPFTVNEQVKLVRDFMNFIENKMRAVEPWKSQDSAEFDNALEAMEKLVMNRLYPYTFTPSIDPAQPITTDDLERDAVFGQRVRLFSWVRERHLDVPEGEAAQGFIGFAEQELLKINHYKAPRDKMICILNCCKVIFGLIRHTLGAENTSADAFVPILIFVVLQANPDNMLSNIEYINRFRNPDKLMGEAGYYLSSLTGAIQFIETMDASSLSSITQEEFEDCVERAIRDLPASPSRVRQPVLPLPLASPSGRGDGAAAERADPFVTADGDEPARALAMTPAAGLALEGTRRFFARTGTLAHEAVSRPLGAIGKILDGMQSEERERARARGPAQPGARARADWEDGDGADAETPTRRGARRPASPSERFAQLGISSDWRSVPGTPPPDGPPLEQPPEFSRFDLQAATGASVAEHERARAHAVDALRGMFPALDAETLEAVLAGCGDDLGVAIDRLLEM